MFNTAFGESLKKVGLDERFVEQYTESKMEIRSLKSALAAAKWQLQVLAKETAADKRVMNETTAEYLKLKGGLAESQQQLTAEREKCEKVEAELAEHVGAGMTKRECRTNGKRSDSKAELDNF